MTGRTNWTGVVYGLSLSFFGAYQMFKLPPALPLLLERYGYDRALAGGFMSVYAFVGFLVSLYIGRAIEQRGIAQPVLIGLGLMILGNLLTLLIPSSGPVVLFARGLEGIAFAVFAIAGPVLANREASPRHLPLIIGLVATWIPAGQIAATLSAPAAFALYGWQPLWWLAIIGCLALVAWTYRLSRQGAVDLHAAPAAARQKLSSASSTQRIALLLGAAIFMIWSGQYFAAMTWLPLFLVESRAMSLDWALAAYLLPVVVLAIFNLVTGMLLRAGVPLGPLFVAALISQAMIWWLLPQGQGAVGVVLLIAYGIGAGISPTCLWAIPSAVLGQNKAAAGAFGVLMTGRNLGVFVGPILIAQIFKWTGLWQDAAPIFAAITAFAVVLALGLAVALAKLSHGTKR